MNITYKRQAALKALGKRGLVYCTYWSSPTGRVLDRTFIVSKGLAALLAAVEA